ncbi:MAG: hypothetical protein ACYSW0_09345 [Planctomycetota bacterium]|jgi:hypothetical protein
MNARLLFNLSAIVEILTGLALLVAPLFVIGLLLGDGLGPVGIAVARVLGIGLLSVGIAGWESPGQNIRLAPRAGLCIYNVGAALVFVILGAYGGMNGVLLWPAAILHALIGAMMLWVILASSQKALGE